jgi:23S rRNA pseudouridine1911/1915/1917 synthase
MRARFVAPIPERLDKLLAAHTRLSRKRARLVIERGGVRVDGVIRKRASFDVDSGALVEVKGAGAPPKSVGAGLEERYRDPWLLVVDKPHGLPCQPTRSGHAQHLFGILQAQERYVGLHHRLDTPASGLVLLSLDKGANKAVAEGFRTNQIHRSYQVVVVGDPGLEGVWSEEIDGKKASTRYRRLAHRDGMSVVECGLDTGRTHQIRRHASSAGTPVVGDRRHGGAAGRLWPRLALHAVQLRLAHPMSEEALVVESPIPADLVELFDRVHGRVAVDGADT